MEKHAIALGERSLPDHPDAVVVTVEGSIVPKTVNQFKDVLQAIAGRGIKRFLLDCARLTYVNSSGLAYLLNLVGAVKPQGGMVALAAVDSKILIIFDMMGITGLFKFYPSIRDAQRDLDEKLARELRDVGPALKLEEEPTPVAPPTPKPSRSGTSVRLAARRAVRVPPPPENPIVRFFRALFGIEETRTTTLVRRTRR
jgi:anti-anti-sigma factor